jgi:hypothetical protein
MTRSTVGPCRHHDDRDIGVGPHPAAHLEAVEVGEAQVEQDDVGPRSTLRESRQHLVATLHALDVEALSGQPFGQRRRDRLVVLDDQDQHVPTLSSAWPLWGRPYRILVIVVRR